jgi:peptide/nickel transport system substrate-binding protein
LVKEYQAAVNVEGQTAAISQIQKHLWENVPASYPYFFNFLSASRREVDGLIPTALGHVILSGASVTE